MIAKLENGRKMSKKKSRSRHEVKISVYFVLPMCHGYWLYSVATSNITGMHPERIESNTAEKKGEEGGRKGVS